MELSTKTLQSISKLSNDYNNRSVATGIGDQSHRELRLVSLYHGAEIVQKEVDKLQAFKDFVHKRLDEAGVPTHPDGKHSKEGCRIGDRLDIVLQPKLDLKSYPKLSIEALQLISAAREQIERLIFNDVPEDIIESMLSPMESVLKHHGVNLEEQDL